MSKAIKQGEIYRDARHRYHTPIRSATHPDGIVPSSTGIIGVLDKSNALIPWAVNVTCDFVLDNFAGPDTLHEVVSRARFEATRVKTFAADLGTMVHDLVEIWVKKQLGMKDVSIPKSALDQPDVANAYSAFLEWAGKVDLHPVLSERMVYSEQLEYAGTLDLVGWMKPEGYDKPGLWLCDVKSSKGFYPQQMAPQLVSYENALMERPPEEMKGHGIDGIGVIRLDKATGHPEWHDCTSMREIAWDSFYTMRALYYHIKERKGVWKY